MAKTITFKNDEDLNRIDRLLSGKRIQKRMPGKVRGKRAPMTLWAIEELSRCLNGNRTNNLQNEQSSDDSEKWQAMTTENEHLKTENHQLKEELEKWQTMPLVMKVLKQGTTIRNLNEKNKELEEQVRKYDELETGYVKTINRYMELYASNYQQEKNVK